VVDDRDARFVADAYLLPDDGLEVLAPEDRREQHAVDVGYVAPDDHAVELAAAGLDLRPGHLDEEAAQAFYEGAELVGVQPHPHEGVLGAYDAPERLVPLEDRAVDGKVRMYGVDRIDPGRAVAGYHITDAGYLVVAAGEEATIVPGVVKLKGCHLLQGIGLEMLEVRHLYAFAPADDGLETGLQDGVVVLFLYDFERLDVRIHVGNGADPVQVVVPVDVGVCWQTEFLLPAGDEGRPEKIAYRNPVGLFMAEGLVHPVQLEQAGSGSLQCGHHHSSQSRWNTSSMVAHHSPGARAAMGSCMGFMTSHHFWVRGSSPILFMSPSKSEPTYSKYAKRNPSLRNME